MNKPQDDWANFYDEEWLAAAQEPAVDPGVPIVDSAHHLMTWPFHYEMPAWLADLESGHKVIATVHVEAHGHYRSDGPEHLKPVGETEYLVKAVEQSAARPSAAGVCAGIVGGGDLACGAAKVDELLDAHAAAAKGRFRGVRINVFWGFHRDGRIFEAPGWQDVAERAELAEGIGRLGRKGLSLDLVTHHINLPVVAKLAQNSPDTVMVVNHLATIMDPRDNPVPEAEMLATWRRGIDTIAAMPNIRLKLGGCANPTVSRSMPAMRAFHKRPAGAPSSHELADVYRPQVSYAIERLGPDRCMFESNFPMDKAFTSYVNLWNAYKHLVQPYSRDEQRALLGGTAIETYKLSCDGAS